MIITLYDLVATVGYMILIFCFARIQWRRDFSKTITYSLLNLLGALMLAASIWGDVFSWAAFLAYAAWGMISLYGVYRCFKYAYRAAAK
jgi:hypothetical protein